MGGRGVREDRERVSGAGRVFQGDRVPHAAPGNCEGSGQFGGGDEGVREHWDRVSVVGGRISKAIEYHTECLASAKQLDDRAGEWQAYGNIGNSYFSMGNFSRAIEYHTQCLATTNEVGDRAGEAGAYGNLGICHLSVYEFVKAVAFYEAQHAIATALKLQHQLAFAAMGIGATLTLQVRADRKGLAAGASQDPGPHSHSSASACLNDRVRRAAKCLQAVLDDPWMEISHLHDCTWPTSPSMRETRKRHWNISKSTSQGECSRDVTRVPGVGKRGAWTRRCLGAAAAVLRGFAAQIIRRWPQESPLWAGIQ